MLQPFKHNVVWAFLAKKMAPSNSLVQRFLWKNRKSGIFEALFQQDNDIVQMWDMAHSICPIKLDQITMRKKFKFFVSDYLNDQFLKVQTKKLSIEFLFNGYCYDLPLYVTSP